MPESVPPDVFGYASSRSRWPDESLHDGLGPIWLQPCLCGEAQTQSSGLVEGWLRSLPLADGLRLGLDVERKNEADSAPALKAELKQIITDLGLDGQLKID